MVFEVSLHKEIQHKDREYCVIFSLNKPIKCLFVLSVCAGMLSWAGGGTLTCLTLSNIMLT